MKIVVRTPLMDLEGAAVHRRRLNQERQAEAHMSSVQRANEHMKFAYSSDQGMHKAISEDRGPRR